MLPTRQVLLVCVGRPPAKIDLSCWDTYALRPYQGEPVRCYRCQRLNHLQARCEHAVRCGLCSLPATKKMRPPPPGLPTAGKSNTRGTPNASRGSVGFPNRANNNSSSLRHQHRSRSRPPHGQRQQQQQHSSCVEPGTLFYASAPLPVRSEWVPRRSPSATYPCPKSGPRLEKISRQATLPSTQATISPSMLVPSVYSRRTSRRRPHSRYTRPDIGKKIYSSKRALPRRAGSSQRGNPRSGQLLGYTNNTSDRGAARQP